MVKNPVLTGFHPDPSMIFRDGVFYIANSTFEYFPGVCISASRDLANWETVSYPLAEKRLLDMRGNPNSAGVWAPNLSYCDGLFYLVYTDLKHWTPVFKDANNYITTAPSVEGPWSDPVYITSSGFDPSLFHDEDGRKYFVNMEWDYRRTGDDGSDVENFTGILITELDPKTLAPVSEAVNVYKGTDRGLVEAPYIHKYDGYYYLFTAEGGTTLCHAETVARAKHIYGPYETHPDKHILSTLETPSSPLQKAGHASICTGPDGRWWIAFLCGRPMKDSGVCPLGRETGVAELVWRDNWPYLKNGSTVPDEYFEGYGQTGPGLSGPIDYDFTSKGFALDFMSLRTPARYETAGGSLRLYGGDSLLSRFDQNMLVRRQCDFSFEFETAFTLPFDHFGRMAGLIYRYNEENQYYLRAAYNEDKGCKTLGILCFDKYGFSMPLGDQEIPAGDTVHLRVKMDGRYGFFGYSPDGLEYIDIPYRLDAARLSDEYATPLGFTSAYVGMCSIDFVDKQGYADFLYARYQPLETKW